MKRKIKSLRRNTGTLSSLIFLAGIGIVLLMGCIAVDVPHFVSANTELQNVADAAALMAAYDLEWTSSAADMSAARNDAAYMVQHSCADLYNTTLNIPFSASSQVTFSSRNGGTNNAVTVTLSPPGFYLFAPFVIGLSPGNGATATAERLPIVSGPTPPWYLGATSQFQGGPTCPSPLPQSPVPSPPTSLPVSAHVTFIDSSKIGVQCAGVVPPILPTYFVDMGLSSLSNAPSPNPHFIGLMEPCNGGCASGPCPYTNPQVIGSSTVTAVHGALNAAPSNIPSNVSYWTNGNTVLLPVTDASQNVTSFYAVKLTGPYVPGSFQNGQGVFGELGVQFVGAGDTIAGVTVADPSTGATYSPGPGAPTVAALVQ
ncbi:MAG TPA: pilus assembly protein TadG-related protein [Oculatellaceae cyanobacterium]